MLKRIFIASCGFLLAAVCAFEFFLTPKASSPSVQVQISLRPLTESEVQGVGTEDIKNPSSADFRKLIINVDGEHLGSRDIRIPTVQDMTEALTDQVVWISHDARQDNLTEDHADYHLETVLFVRNLTERELKEKLRNLKVSVAYATDGGKQIVRRNYPLSAADGAVGS